MYFRNQTRQCLICHENLNNCTSLYHIIYHPCLCTNCLQKFEVVYLRTKFLEYPLTILYRYNDFIRQVLYQYKGLDDYVLKDVFLNGFNELKERYLDYIVVVVPSSKQDNERRGFCPNEEIVKTFSRHIFTGLYKKSAYKQTTQKDRRLIRKVMKIKDGHLLTNRKVLIFDDVMTSSNTIRCAINLIKPYYPQLIEILILSSNQINSFSEK